MLYVTTLLIHRPPTIVIFNFYNPNALESLVIIPDVPPSHTYTPLLTSNPFMSLYRLTDKFFHNCSTHPNPLVRQIGNYTLPDLHKQYRKYIHKRTKYLLCNLSPSGCSVFSIVIIFHCRNIDVSYIYSPKPLDFYGRKNPQHAFLRRGSKRICPMSQLCGMYKNPVIYINYGLLAKFQV